MKRILPLILIIPVVGTSACGETYKAVNGSNPPQVVVSDGGDKIDRDNLREACLGLGEFKVDRTQYVGNGRTSALVTCAPR